MFDVHSMEKTIIATTSFPMFLALKVKAEKLGYSFNPLPGRDEIIEEYWLRDSSNERHLDFYDNYNQDNTFSFSNNNKPTHTLPQDWDKVITIISEGKITKQMEKVKEFSVASSSFALLTAAKTLAEQNKWMWDNFNDFTERNWLVENSSKKRRLWFRQNGQFRLSNESGSTSSNILQLVLPQDWMKFEELIEKPIKQDITIRLNSDTKAVVTPKEVVVGCQTFQFVPLIELWKAIHSPAPKQEPKEQWISLFYSDSNKRWTVNGSGMYPIIKDSEIEALDNLSNRHIKIAIPVKLPIPEQEYQIMVTLNSNYKAVIKNNTVTVDSRIFTFEAIDKLYEAIQKQQS